MNDETFYNRVCDLSDIQGEVLHQVKRLTSQGIIKPENFEDNYRDIYPIVAAAMERIVWNYLYGSPYEEEHRRCRRLANKYKKSMLL